MSIQGGAFFTKLTTFNNELYIQTPKCSTKQGFVKSGKKLHCDLLTDIDCIDTFIKELKDLARKHKFLIMEDSKIGDVDKITYKHY